MRALCAVLLLGWSLAAGAQDRYLVDWDAVGEETLGRIMDVLGEPVDFATGEVEAASDPRGQRDARVRVY